MSGWTKRGALVTTMGALVVIGIASCSLGDYQPPPASNTTSSGGAGGTGGVTGPGGAGGMGGDGGGVTGPGGAGGGGGGAAGGGEACMEQGSRCIAPVPTNDGWTGPYWGRGTDLQMGPQPCPDNGPPDVILQADPSPNDCNACECQVSEGVGCAGATVSCWANSGCSSGTPKEITSGCVGGASLPGGLGPSSCKVTALPVPKFGEVACEPKLPSTGLKYPSLWRHNVYLCDAGPAASACADGGSCLTPPSGFYSDFVCIKNDAEVNACPEGWADAQYMAYASFAEGRSCPDCACDSSKVECATDGVFLMTPFELGCSANDPLPLDVCKNVGAGASIEVKPPAPKLGVDACPTPQGQGEVQTSGPTTVCCKSLVTPP